MHTKKKNNPAILEDLLKIEPLIIEKDRYNGIYSGAKYLAFNMSAFSVWELNFNSSDMDCQYFWEYDAKNYIIGKGDTPVAAVIDLKQKIDNTKNTEL